MAAKILHELVQSLEGCFEGRSLPAVKTIHRPPGGSGERTSPFTLVVLEGSPLTAGLCFNLLEGPHEKARYDDLDLAALASSGDGLCLARRVLEEDPVERVVGYAACHALSQLLLRQAHEGALPSAGWRESESDLVQLLGAGGADHVGVVGFAPPMVGRILDSGVGEVTVLERPSRAQKLAPSRGAVVTTAKEDLTHCNKVLITSTTLLNDTFDGLEELTRGADFRALYGPGAGLLPDPLLARGIDAMAGIVVTDAEALVERQLGGKRWGDAKRKVVLISS